MKLAAVVIGRNEGTRLIRCLASLSNRMAPVVYVDSGSTDGSVAAARAAGADVVELDMSHPFTAARARNAGLQRLASISDTDFVQVIDGDCEMHEDWPETALSFLADHPEVAVVAGRLRECAPEASVWNRLADREWDTPVGQTDAVGGIALLRRDAVEAAGGYRETLIAGEEPELCLRLRQSGWRIWRLEADMALHDIAMTRFSQWWRRTRRHGVAIAEGAFLHGVAPERYCVRQRDRAVLWGAVLPLAALAGVLLISPLALGLLLAWPAQVVRLRLKGTDWAEAFFLTLGKLPEAQGVLSYHLRRFSRAVPKIIEYK